MQRQMRYQTRYQLNESKKAREKEDHSPGVQNNVVANQQSIADSNEPNVSESHDVANSSTDDTYITTAPNGTAIPERNGLQNSPLGNFPPELFLWVNQLLMENAQKVVVVPRVMTRKHSLDPLEDPNEPMLVFATKSPLAATSTHMHNEYVAGLQREILSLRFPRLELHVLDFDFSPIVCELLSHFDATQQDFFNTRARSITIHLTITSRFVNLPDENGLQRWLKWRAAEASAGREINVDYRIRRQNSINTANDMQALSFFMLLFDPTSEGEVEADVFDIMETLNQFFASFLAKQQLKKTWKLNNRNILHRS
jgi:hypothetical protein